MLFQLLGNNMLAGNLYLLHIGIAGQINDFHTVQQRTGDFLHVFLHLPVRAGAAGGGMPSPTAATGVHSTQQLEPGGEMERAAGAGDRDFAVQIVKDVVLANMKALKLEEWIREKQKTTYVRINGNRSDSDFQYPGWGKN